MEKRILSGNWMRVCIDQLSVEEFSGTVYAKQWKEPMPFRSYHEFLLNTDQMFDCLGFPQSFQESRSFKRDRRENCEHKYPREEWTDEELSKHTGKKKTGNLLVVSRRKSTWQGILKLSDWDTERQFFSDLELMNYLLE